MPMTLTHHPAAYRFLRRHPEFNEDEAARVLMMIEAGTPLSMIGDISGLPPYWVVNYWRKQHPWFDEAVVAASEAKAERLMDETLAIADDENRAPACREVSIKARWMAMKVYNRKRFDPATRVEVTQAVAAGDGMSTAELERLVAREREARAQAIEGECVREGESPPLLGGGGLSGD